MESIFLYATIGICVLLTIADFVFSLIADIVHLAKTGKLRD